MTLTKAELADLLFEKVGLNKREAKDMVEAFFEEIRNADLLGFDQRETVIGFARAFGNTDGIQAHPLQEVMVTTHFAAKRVRIYLSDGDLNLAILNFKSDAVAGVERGKQWSGIHHIGFEVESLEAIAEKLAAAGSVPRDDVNRALGVGHGRRDSPGRGCRHVIRARNSL